MNRIPSYVRGITQSVINLICFVYFLRRACVYRIASMGMFSIVGERVSGHMCILYVQCSPNNIRDNRWQGGRAHSYFKDTNKSVNIVQSMELLVQVLKEEGVEAVFCRLQG